MTPSLRRSTRCPSPTPRPGCSKATSPDAATTTPEKTQEMAGPNVLGCQRAGSRVRRAPQESLRPVAGPPCLAHLLDRHYKIRENQSRCQPLRSDLRQGLLAPSEQEGFKTAWRTLRPAVSGPVRIGCDSAGPPHKGVL